jgi:hypothetical protein
LVTNSPNSIFIHYAVLALACQAIVLTSPHIDSVPYQTRCAGRAE